MKKRTKRIFNNNQTFTLIQLFRLVVSFQNIFLIKFFFCMKISEEINSFINVLHTQFSLNHQSISIQPGSTFPSFISFHNNQTNSKTLRKSNHWYYHQLIKTDIKLSCRVSNEKSVCVVRYTYKCTMK